MIRCATQVGDLRSRRAPNHRQGTRGLQGGNRMAVAARVVERVERLRASLEEPLLVTTGVNVRYLVGFQSSNAAVFVDEDRTLLFTDFRYAESARAVPGVEFVQAQRLIVNTVGETLRGRRIGFEASALTYDAWERLREAGV